MQRSRVQVASDNANSNPNSNRPAQKASGGGSSGAAARRSLTETGLFQVRHRRQVELAGHHEGGAAPVGAEAARIDRAEAARELGGVIAGERVAVGLAQVGLVVAEVEGEHALGDADAQVPLSVALVGNAVRERQGASGNADLRAVEGVAGAEPPVTDLAGDVNTPAGRQGGARRGELASDRRVGTV